jgi:hypothetical protein
MAEDALYYPEPRMTPARLRCVHCNLLFGSGEMEPDRDGRPSPCCTGCWRRYEELARAHVARYWMNPDYWGEAGQARMNRALGVGLRSVAAGAKR